MPNPEILLTKCDRQKGARKRKNGDFTQWTLTVSPRENDPGRKRGYAINYNKKKGRVVTYGGISG